MKRLIFLLAICLIGFVGMSNGVQDEQRAAQPDAVSFYQQTLTLISHPAIGVNAVTVIVDLPFNAIVPELAVDLADYGAYVLSEAVIKPPGTPANFQATNNRYNENARDWVTHRSFLCEKTSFLLMNFVMSPNAFY
jgi:hypothetical protein